MIVNFAVSLSHINNTASSNFCISKCTAIFSSLSVISAISITFSTNSYAKVWFAIPWMRFTILFNCFILDRFDQRPLGPPFSLLIIKKWNSKRKNVGRRQFSYWKEELEKIETIDRTRWLSSIIYYKIRHIYFIIV